MRTLADFKRALVPGSVWEFYHSGTGKTRTSPVYKLQTNSVAFASADADSTHLSWLEWPKAKDVSFVTQTDGRVSIRIKNPAFGPDSYLQYTKVSS